MMRETRRFVIVCGPRGAGKDTLQNAMHVAYPHAQPLITCTTRPPRSGEKNGVDYYFLTREAYGSQNACGYFYWDRGVGANRYSLAKRELRRVHGLIITDVAREGAVWLREKLTREGDKVLLIGVFAPRDTRFARIKEREPHLSEADVARKLTEEPSPEDLSLYGDFDLLLHNTSSTPEPMIREALVAVEKFLKGDGT